MAVVELSKPVRFLVSGVFPTCFSLFLVGAFAYLNEYQERRRNKINLYSKAFLNGARRIGDELSQLLQTPPTEKSAREIWAKYQCKLHGSEPFVSRYVLSAASGHDLAQQETQFRAKYMTPANATGLSILTSGTKTKRAAGSSSGGNATKKRVKFER